MVTFEGQESKEPEKKIYILCEERSSSYADKLNNALQHITERSHTLLLRSDWAEQLERDSEQVSTNSDLLIIIASGPLQWAGIHHVAREFARKDRLLILEFETSFPTPKLEDVPKIDFKNWTGGRNDEPFLRLVREIMERVGKTVSFSAKIPIEVGPPRSDLPKILVAYNESDEDQARLISGALGTYPDEFSASACPIGRPSKSEWDELVARVEKSDCFVYVWTDNSADKDDLSAKLYTVALKQKKGVSVLRSDNSPRWDPSFGENIDLRGWNFDTNAAKWLDVIDTIRKAIGTYENFGGESSEQAEISADTNVTDPAVLLRRPLAAQSDSYIGEDKLGAKDEAEAIADWIALKDFEPPLVVGILGGWGTGKSFVMNLIKNRLIDIRCHRIDDADQYPYVGHNYIVEFNAWTYAKSNLWASLMKEILTQLNDQFTFESLLRECKEYELTVGGDHCSRIYTIPANDLEHFMKHPVGQEALKSLNKIEQDGQTIWEKFREIQNTEVRELERKKDEQRELTGNIELAKRELESRLKERLNQSTYVLASKNAASDAVREVTKRVAPQFLEAFDKSKGELSATTSWMFKSGAAWIDFVSSKPLQTGAILVLFAALFYGADLVATKYSLAELQASFVEVFLPSIVSVVTTVGMFVKRAGKITTFLKEASSRLDQTRDTVVERDKKRVVSVLRDELGLESFEALSASLAREIEQLGSRVSPFAEFKGVGEYVKSRLGDQDYQTELGTLFQVEEDLKKLSKALSVEDSGGFDPFIEEKRKLFRRGRTRVYLMIDDIDRCPPEMVVQILEATQLLVKTNLFVVILGMDVRYVTRALEHHYAGILTRDGNPSGLDYIEKIVQIPYRVRPIAPEKMEEYIRAQMGIENHVDDVRRSEAEGSTSASSDADSVEKASSGASDTPEGSGDEDKGAGPESLGSSEEPDNLVSNLNQSHPIVPIAFDEVDLKEVELRCKLSEVTPRSAKRIVNVFKLWRGLWQKPGVVQPELEIQYCMISLLSLSASYPEVMREVLHGLENAIRRGSEYPEAFAETIESYISKKSDTFMRKNYREADWKRVNEIVRTNDLKLDITPVASLSISNIQLVNSFSFVGELDLDQS
ncbi:hypothetical protein JYU19_02115 [bacterium AH-315-J21]|nr:hypothetical protein [bacterium AH-315-J21]